MSYRFLFAVSLFLNLAANAQQRRLVAATLDGEPSGTKGFVRLPAAGTTPQVFAFTTDKNGSFRDVTVTDARRVSLENGRVYERRHIRASVLAAKPYNRTKESYAGAEVIDREIFVELLIAGKVSLYRFDDVHRYPHFYVAIEGDSLSALPYDPYLNEHGQLQGNLAYQNELFRIATNAGCGSRIEKEILLLNYETSGMMELVQRINRCKGGSEGKEYGPGSVTATRLGVHLSGSSFRKPSAVTENGTTFNAVAKGTTYAVGAFIDIHSRRPDPKVMYTFSAYYTPLNYELEYPVPAYSTYSNVARIRTDAKYHFLALEPSVRYVMGKGPMRPFVEGGANVRLFLSGTGNTTYYDTNGNSSYYFRGQVESSLFRYEALAGAGIQMNRGSFHLRYAHGLRKYAPNYLSAVLHLRLW